MAQELATHTPAAPATSTAPARDGAAADDTDLLDAIAGGDMVAYGAFYDRHSRAAYGLAWRMVGETKAAETVVEQAFLLLWHEPRRGRDGPGTERAALLARVRACARVVLRERALPVAPARAYGDDAHVERHSPAPDRRLGAEGQGVTDAVGRLPTLRRRALLLAYFGGCQGQEIAAILGISLRQAHQELRRGLEDLRPISKEQGL